MSWYKNRQCLGGWQALFGAGRKMSRRTRGQPCKLFVRSAGQWRKTNISILNRYANLLLPKLDEMHAQQVKDGKVRLDDTGQIENRIQRTYPF